MGMDDYIDLRSFSNEVASAFPANRLYCLVDHAGMPGLHAELMRAGVPWTSLFAASREAEALKAAPLLFPLDEEARKAHSQLLPWVARHGSFTSSMIMLSSPLALDELGRRLARRMNARISENMEVLLRYFDPRVFEALIPELEADQRDAFTGVADCWWYVDRTGNPVPQRAAYDAASPLHGTGFIYAHGGTAAGGVPAPSDGGRERGGNRRDTRASAVLRLGANVWRRFLAGVAMARSIGAGTGRDTLQRCD
jgi:hypothetical protein